MAGQYKQPVQYRRESAIKAGHGELLPHLESTYTIFNTSSRRRTRPSTGPERNQQLQIPPSLNSKAVLQRPANFSCCANIGGRLIFPMRQHFCRLQHFSSRQVFTIRQRFWMRQVFTIRQTRQVFVYILRRLYFCIFFCILI